MNEIQSTLDRRNNLNMTIQKDLTRILNHLNDFNEDESLYNVYPIYDWKTIGFS